MNDCLQKIILPGYINIRKKFCEMTLTCQGAFIIIVFCGKRNIRYVVWIRAPAERKIHLIYSLG
jgi:hypothetical protein